MTYRRGRQKLETESNGSLLDQLLEPAQSDVPPLRDQIEVPMSYDQPLGLQLPTALAAQPPSAHQAGIGEDAQMFRNPLAGEGGAPSQSRDGLGPVLAEAGHQFEARRVPQRREDGSGALEPGRFTIRRHGFRRR